MKQLLKRSATLVALVRGERARAEKRRRARRMSPPVYLKQIDAYLRAHSLRKLQIGSGPVSLPGWLNSDFYPVAPNDIFLDATHPFPFANRTFDCIFTEHVIEHVTYPEGRAMLDECFRVLKPGGWIRLATPDLKKFVDLFSHPQDERQRRYIEWSVAQNHPQVETGSECFVLNSFVRNWGHQFIYDAPTLGAALRGAGFGALRPCRPGESQNPALRHLESHGQQIGEEFNEFETMVIEAQRPAAA